MKPTHTDKSNYLPQGVADTEGQISQLIEEKALSPDVNLRAYRSAAVLGLAISLGASGVLLPRQGDEAIAAEPFTLSPTASTQVSGLNLSPDNNQLAATPGSNAQRSSDVPVSSIPVSSIPVSNVPVSNVPVSKASPEAVEPSSPVVIAPIQTAVYHQVQSGDNFWLLAQKYQVSPEAIAQVNNLDVKATLTVGQSLKIPTTNTIHEMRLGEISEVNSPTYGVSKAQLQNISTSNTPTNIQGSASPEPILQARQNDALRNLRAQRDQLRETLGGWRVERNSNPNLINQNNLVASVPSQPSPAAVSGWLNSNQASQQVLAQAPTVVASAQGSPSQTKESTTSTSNHQGATALVPSVTSADSVVTTGNNSPATNTNQLTTPAVTPSIPVVITTPSSPNAGNANWVNNSSRVATTNSWVASNPTPVPASPTIFAAIPTTSVFPPVITQEVAASPSEFHQVRPGETLDAIARRYGISRQEIARANRINNPNLLFVDQRLTIPVSPNRAITATPAGVDNPQKSSSSSDVSLVSPGGVFGGGSASSESGANSSTTQLTQDELVTARLRADIRRMREEHQQQTVGQPVLISQNSASTSNQDSRPLFTNDSGGLERVNPQFRASTEAASSPLPAQPQLVATAPSPAGTYNPMLQLPVGQVVSPDLPPLAPADTYLPNSPARFNGYIWPAEGVLTSGYGMRWGRMHRGIDIAAPTGTPIMAAAPGVVVTAGWNDGGYGNLVEIKHPDGSLTLYAHNDRILVREGQQVAQGEQVSEMGTTGFSTGPHLHFEIHPTGRGAVNPVALMPRE